MLPDKKLRVYLALAILLFFLAPEIFYWVFLDNFQMPLREVLGDSSLYASQLNAVLKHGQPTGNPYFAENQYQLGRFFVFGTLFSLIPFADEVAIGWWLIIFKVLVALLVFWLFSRLLALFNVPPRLAVFFSFIFVLFYGAVTFKGGSALYGWYLPAFLGGFLIVARFFKSETISLSNLLPLLVSPVLFAFHPLYFAVGISVTGLLWLHFLYSERLKSNVGHFLIWFFWTLFLFSQAFLPFIYPRNSGLALMVQDMAFRNTLISTHFPFLFLFGLRFLLLVITSALMYLRLARVEKWGRNYLIVFILSLVAFVGLNSYIVTGKYFLNDHFPFFEEFIVIPLALMLIFGPSLSQTRATRFLGLATLVISAASVLVIWNYLNFKPVYFGAEVPQYLAYFAIGLLLFRPGLKQKLFRDHGRLLLKSLIGLAIFHIVFMTFWDDKYWFPLHRQVQDYRPLIQKMSELPPGVVLANPYISNLALVYTGHKAYWSPIAFHDLVATEELYQRWLRAKTVFPVEPAFNGRAAVVSIFGRRDNKCREFRRGFYLGLLAKVGFEEAQRTICYDPTLETKWPELEAEAKAYDQGLRGDAKWDPVFRIDYLVVEKSKDQPTQELVKKYFEKISEDEKFAIFSKNP